MVECVTTGSFAVEVVPSGSGNGATFGLTFFLVGGGGGAVVCV